MPNWLVPAVMTITGLVMFLVPHHGLGNNFHGRTLAANLVDILGDVAPDRPKTWIPLLGALGVLGVFFPSGTTLLLRGISPEWERAISAIGGAACCVAAAWLFVVIMFSHANFMTGYPLAPSTPFSIAIPALEAILEVWLIGAAIFPAFARVTGIVPT